MRDIKHSIYQFDSDLQYECISSVRTTVNIVVILIRIEEAG